MAQLKPFAAYRYASAAGDPADLLTQPYDKISAAMQARYLARSPHNLVRIILGERDPLDTDAHNVYTRGADLFKKWIQDKILIQDPAPGFYAYFQDFEVPDSRQRFTRKGFIGLGKVEDYAAGVVFRHEQTLSGPKKDRLEVLRHTRAHFGQIFMLYPDHENAVDRELDEAAQGMPLTDVIDEYGTRHRLWEITDATAIARIEQKMAPMKLLIADGHHRYETALSYRDEHPENPAAQYVMMTFINMYSHGLKILATHRVISDLPNFEPAELVAKITGDWTAERMATFSELKHVLENPRPDTLRIGVVTAHDTWLLKRPRKDLELDVPVLHDEILKGWLGISEEAVREEKHLRYVRGMDAAAAEVREKGAQLAFLLEPTPIDAMARIAFSGGVMPQKSTDFYPKLLTGISIYRL